jgi:hypothetical protein
MTSDKPFDCVEMKHRAAEIVQARLAGMTPDEQQAYWDRLTREFLDEQARLRREKYGEDASAAA